MLKKQCGLHTSYLFTCAQPAHGSPLTNSAHCTVTCTFLCKKNEKQQLIYSLFTFMLTFLTKWSIIDTSL